MIMDWFIRNTTTRSFFHNTSKKMIKKESNKREHKEGKECVRMKLRKKQNR